MAVKNGSFVVHVKDFFGCRCVLFTRSGQGRQCDLRSCFMEFDEGRRYVGAVPAGLPAIPDLCSMLFARAGCVP